MEQEIIEMAVRAGMPRTAARVHHDLALSEDGQRTAAELTHRLKVSPASVSVAVNFLVQQGFVRRKRDPRRRRDIYVIDDDAWYHAILLIVNDPPHRAIYNPDANLHTKDPASARCRGLSPADHQEQDQKFSNTL